eukprot:TRINITY_DN14655_c0_g1_i2.p1 TRINITY_DN14655_c0_g1~~TRINITY_DN14655_c0_g1_i2.p1  ORF type:complete len:131 (-),score=3.89 TRINITY_DN14655_c0_g1_i2:134-526(-)
MTAMQHSMSYELWDMVELMLAHQPTILAMGLDPATLRSPFARYLKAVQLCRADYVGLPKQELDAYRGAYQAAYRVAYQVVREERGLPVGVSEIVCENVAHSRGLAQGSVTVSREFRKLLHKLARVQSASI